MVLMVRDPIGAQSFSTNPPTFENVLPESAFYEYWKLNDTNSVINLVEPTSLYTSVTTTLSTSMALSGSTVTARIGGSVSILRDTPAGYQSWCGLACVVRLPDEFAEHSFSIYGAGEGVTNKTFDNFRFVERPSATINASQIRTCHASVYDGMLYVVPYFSPDNHGSGFPKYDAFLAVNRNTGKVGRDVVVSFPDGYNNLADGHGTDMGGIYTSGRTTWAFDVNLTLTAQN